MTKGTAESRFQKARLLNLRFYDNLQEHIKNDMVAPRTFCKTLKDTLGAKNFGLDIMEENNINQGKLMYAFDHKAESRGYLLSLPLTLFNEKIHKNSCKTFLHRTQTLFNELFNPKIFCRYISLVNKNRNIKTIMNFYGKNISETNTLTQETLNKFIEKVPSKAKVDVLQLFRYKLLSEQNTHRASNQIDKKIQHYNNFTYVRPEGFYNLDKYKYDEKFEIINKKLLDTIKKHRKS